jgi:hypothetical protein
VRRSAIDFGNLPPLLKIRTVSELAGGIHYSTVRRAWRRGLISGQRFNQRVVYFNRDSVLKWLGLPMPASKTNKRSNLKREVAIA